MWRLVVCVVVAVILDWSLAETKLYGVSQPQRLKRSPHYYCPPGPPGPPGPPFWPPPPPPPFWPPPPPPPPHYWGPPGPPPYDRHDQNQYQGIGQSQALAQSQAQAQAQAQSQASSQSSNDLNSQVEHLDHQDLKQPPCDSCGQNSAVSNAESDSGSAVAIAIARVQKKD